MTKTILISAGLTGLFCAVFAVFVQTATNMLGIGQVAGVSFISGFLGSLFARFVMGVKK